VLATYQVWNTGSRKTYTSIVCFGTASYNYRGVKFSKELAADICKVPDLQIDVEISGPSEMLVAVYQIIRCHFMEACNLYSQNKKKPHLSQTFLLWPQIEIRYLLCSEV